MTSSRLQRISLFEGLSEVQLLRLEELCVEEKFAKNQYLFRQGEPSDWLYIILKGRVKLVRHAPNGAATIIEIYSIGDELNAAALVEGKTYSASAKTLTDGIAIKLSHAHFKKMLSEWSIVGSNMMRELGQRYREMVENLSTLAVYSVEGRLCKVMASLARRYGIIGDCRGVIVDLGLTRQDLADISGTTLETAIRTLNRLRTNGLLSWEGKRFFIPDVKALDAVVCPG
mgnify:FL=1